MVFALLLAAALGTGPDSLPAIPGYDLRVEQSARVATRIGAVIPLINPEWDHPAPRGAAAVRTVRRFVAGHPGFYRLEPGVDSLVVLAAVVAGPHIFVQFGQRHRGRPVLCGPGFARVSRDGEIDVISTEFASSIEDDPGPMLSPARAIEIASPRHPPVPGARPDPGEPIYRTFGGKWRLVYHVRMPRRGTPGYNVTVDAFSGEILEDYFVPWSDPR